MTNVQNELKIRQDLADLYCVMAYFKWDDLIYTHSSARIPGTNQFLINSFGTLFSEVTADSLIKLEIDTTIHETVNLAGFTIHNAIYKVRPEVNYIIHTHTKEGIAVSANRKGLLPISQYSTFVLNSLAYHEYNGMILDNEEEVAIQNSLGDKNYLIMRNHGLLTVSTTVDRAFKFMYNLQKACEVQVLTNTDDCVFITDSVLSGTTTKVQQFSKASPHIELGWEAAKKLSTISKQNK